MICGIICQGGEGGGAATTWNPSDKHADITLSGGNLIATQTTTGGYRNVRSISGYDTGKRYFECRLNAGTSAADIIVIGLGTASASLSSFISISGGSSYSCGLAPDGFAYNGPSGGIGTDTGKPIAVAEWAGLAVNFATSKAWVRDATGWSGDPEAGTGNSFTLPGNVLYAMVGGLTTGDEIEANFGASAFAYALPSGFTAWDGDGGGGGESEAVAAASGVGAAAAVGEGEGSVAAASGAGASAVVGASVNAGDAAAAGTGASSMVGEEVGAYTERQVMLASPLGPMFVNMDAARQAMLPGMMLNSQ